MINKKTLLLVAVVAALSIASCNTPATSDSNTTTEQAAADRFKPTGNIERDAQAIADMIIQSSKQMMDGTANIEESQAQTDQMISMATQYYDSLGKREEFQKALNTATEVSIDSLGVLLGKGQR